MSVTTSSSSVSIAMAVYNGLAYLPAQMVSLLEDLEPSDELIVVDDASSDGSFEWLSGLTDPRLSVHRNESNQGIRTTFERCLFLTRNETVFLCDQDDIWVRGKRAAFVLAFSTEPRPLVVISDAEVIDADGAVVAPSFMETRRGFNSKVLPTLARSRYLGCAMAVRRDLIDVALPLPRHVPMHDMWLGVLGACLGTVRYLPFALTRYRRHGGNASPSSPQSFSRMLRWRLLLLCCLLGRLVAVWVGRRGSDRQHAGNGQED